MDESLRQGTENVPQVCEEEPVKGWLTQANNDEYEWEWAVPDLREGGDWHTVQVASLKAAIGKRENTGQILEEGLKALDRHQTNYTDEGPK
jgi:hypothetical protein